MFVQLNIRSKAQMALRVIQPCKRFSALSPPVIVNPANFTDFERNYLLYLFQKWESTKINI
jgi:hypothetical protein